MPTLLILTNSSWLLLMISLNPLCLDIERRKIIWTLSTHRLYLRHHCVHLGLLPTLRVIAFGLMTPMTHRESFLRLPAVTKGTPRRASWRCWYSLLKSVIKSHFFYNSAGTIRAEDCVVSGSKPFPAVAPAAVPHTQPSISGRLVGLPSSPAQ